MIKNFEEITANLTPEEEALVHIIVKRFKDKPGKENIVTNPKMIAGLKANLGVELSEPRIRKIVQFIRLNNILPGLVGTSKGYFYAENEADIETWIDSMKQRENAIRASREIAEQHLAFLRIQKIQKNNIPVQQELF